jgi:hypothetical protein
MAFQPRVDTVPQSFDHLYHGYNIKEMQSESIAICGKIEIATVDTVPQSNISANSSVHKLSQTAHASHRIRIS